MRKLFLGVLFVVMIFGVMGIASADFTGTFSNPVTGNFYKGTVNVAFTNTAGLNGLNLEYKSGTDCNVLTGTWNTLTTFGNNVGSYNWATNTVSDGTYCLILQAGSGTTFATSGVFTIDNSIPTAVISVSGNAVPFSSLTFNGTGSTDTGSGIANYAWTFGDGGVATTAIANHAYSQPGTYQITLTVTDNVGNYNTVILPLNVIPIPYSGTFSYDAVIKGIQDLGSSFNAIITPTPLTGCAALSGVPSRLIVGVNGNTCTLTWTNIPYNQEGSYTFPIRATDGATIKYFNVTVNAYTWMISLQQGWDVFSIPLMPNDASLIGVLGGIQSNINHNGNSIFQYDAVNSVWDKSTSTLSGGSLTQIVPGYAYWINMNNSATLKGFGYLNPTGGQPLSVNVVNGWNLIGQYGLGTSTALTDALSSLRLGSTEYWDTVYNAGTSAAVTTMDTFNGYWMSAKFLPNGMAQYTASTQAINSVTP
jgi:hypothetical protein